MYAAEMSHVYEEMSSLEMEVEERTGVLIPGLDPPPPPPAVSAPPPTTATINTTRDTQQPTTRSSNISNPPRRNTMPNNSNRRCRNPPGDEVPGLLPSTSSQESQDPETGRRQGHTGPDTGCLRSAPVPKRVSAIHCWILRLKKTSNGFHLYVKI